MPHHYPRSDRVRKWIQQELSDLISRAATDPRLKLVSCTAVHLSPDMSHAKVFFCTAHYGAEEVRRTQEALEKAAGFLRRELAHRLHMRGVPTLMFVYDESAERADHLNRLINEGLRPVK